MKPPRRYAPMGGSLAPVRVAGFRWNGWQPSAVYAVVATTYIITSHKAAEKNLLSGFYEAAVVAAKLLKNEHRIVEAINTKFASSGEQNILPVDAKALSEKDVKEEERRKEELENKKRDNKTRALNALQDYKNGTLLLIRHLHLASAAAEHFLQLHNLGLEQTLKTHLRSYALSLLANHWKSLATGCGKADNPIGFVMATVQRDCSGLIPKHSDGAESRTASEFFRLLYSISFNLATQLQAWLIATNDKNQYDFSTATFSIKPFHYEGRASQMIRTHFRDANGEPPPKIHLYRPLCVNLSLPAALKMLPLEIRRELN